MAGEEGIDVSEAGAGLVVGLVDAGEIPDVVKSEVPVLSLLESDVVAVPPTN